MTSSVNHRVDTNTASWYRDVGDFATAEHQQHGSDVVVDSRCEPVPNVPTSTASAGQNDGQQVDSDRVSCMDGTVTACEVRYQPVGDRRSPMEVACDTTCSQHPASFSDPASDHNTAECRDWQFFAACRVDPHLLLDVLLARKHRDRAAREFLLSLPASVLKMYEIFSRQHPIFVCLDIVK